MAGTTDQDTPTRKDTDSKVLLRNRIRQELEKTLKGFNFKQLTQKEIVNQFELEPRNIYETLYKLKLPSSKLSVVGLLDRRIKNSFSIEEIKGINQTLKLYKTAFCSKQKKWTLVRLLEPVEGFNWQTELRAIIRDYLQSFRIKGLNADVKVIEHDDMVWVMIVEKQLTRRKGVKSKTPVFLCYEINTPCFFITSSSRLQVDVLECITKAMQFKKYKFHQLDGKDVQSMLSLLKNRETYKENLSNIVYENGDVEIGTRCVDFSQAKARENYANKVFDTRDPVVIDTFTAHIDAVWQENVLVPEMAGEHMIVKVELVSKTGNVVNTIKNFQKNNILATPLPNYLQKIVKSAKNKVEMRTAGYIPG